MTVSARAGDTLLVSATLNRTWGPDGVTPLKVSDNGLVGEFDHVFPGAHQSWYGGGGEPGMPKHPPQLVWQTTLPRST